MNAPIMPSEAAAKPAKIVARLASGHDGERAAAALLATRLLRELGFTWAELVETALRPPPAADASIGRTAAPAGDGRDAVAWLWQRRDRLTAWEVGFISSLMRRRGPFTAKQSRTLCTIVQRLRAER